MTTGRVSLGVAAALGPGLIADLAVRAEAAGFARLWVNDTPGGDAIGALGAAAAGTTTLSLATGVVPVDRRPAAEIVDAVRAAALPADRLVLGIGSGQLREGALARVREAAGALRHALGCPVVVGALGPRMRRLAAEDAEGVLLNWVPAAEASEQARVLREVDPSATVAVYVRTAVDPAAFDRLRGEARQYASYPNYAANFARLGVDAIDTAILGEAGLRGRLAEYAAGVDEVVLRAVTPDDSAAAYEAFIDATAPGRS